METRKIGSLSVSVVGLGCSNFGMRTDEKRSGEVIGAALDSGINFFDTADMYANGKSEELAGRFLEARISFAESRGHTLLELAFSWLLAHRPVASVIAGATSADQIRGNAAAADWRLGPNDLEEIDSLLGGATGACTGNEN